MRRAGVRLPRCGIGEAAGAVDGPSRRDDQALAVGVAADDAGLCRCERKESEMCARGVDLCVTLVLLYEIRDELEVSKSYFCASVCVDLRDLDNASLRDQRFITSFPMLSYER